MRKSFGNWNYRFTSSTKMNTNLHLSQNCANFFIQNLNLQVCNSLIIQRESPFNRHKNQRKEKEISVPFLCQLHSFLFIDYFVFQSKERSISLSHISFFLFFLKNIWLLYKKKWDEKWGNQKKIRFDFSKMRGLWISPSTWHSLIFTVIDNARPAHKNFLSIVAK